MFYFYEINLDFGLIYFYLSIMIDYFCWIILYLSVNYYCNELLIELS